MLQAIQQFDSGGLDKPRAQKVKLIYFSLRASDDSAAFVTRTLLKSEK
jgi:hypothetical protein